MKQHGVKTIMITLLLSTILPLAKAQHGSSVSRVVRLNRAPVNNEVLHVQLPRPKQIALPNGLTVLILARHAMPTVAFALWVKSGALQDPKDLPGLAKFTAEMLKEGTTHRTSAQLAADVDAIGATLEASATFGSDISIVTASGLIDNVDRILDLMSDVVVNPTFPSDELEKYKTRQLAELQEERANPHYLGRERLFQVLYRDFPASRISPTADSIRRASVDQLKQFHDHHYIPNNAILGVVGDVTADSILPLIEKYFGYWKSGTIVPSDLGTVPPPVASKVVLVDRPDSVQTNILVGDYAVRRTDPDFVPLTVMNRILGGSPASRLFLILREEKGYTYGAYSHFSANIYPGAWMAGTEVRNDVTDGSLKTLMDQFHRIREQKVPVEELDEARRSIIANFALSLEHPSGLLDRWMMVNYYRLPENYWDKYPVAVSEVTADAVQRVAEKYVDLNHLQIVCVGDGKQIKGILAKYGSVEVYGVNGKRLD